MVSLDEIVKFKNISKHTRLENKIFFILILKKKVKKIPNKNKTKGILFPETNIPTPTILVTTAARVNLV